MKLDDAIDSDESEGCMSDKRLYSGWSYNGMPSESDDKRTVLMSATVCH